MHDYDDDDKEIWHIVYMKASGDSHQKVDDSGKRHGKASQDRCGKA